MHLVFATSIVPDGQPSSGYEIANAAIIDALRRAGARVTVLGFTWPGRRPSRPKDTVVLGEVDVRTDNASFTRKLRWVAKAVLTGATFSSVKLRQISSGDLRDAIGDIGHFDAYVLNSVQLAGAFEDVFVDRPSIFVAHNVEHRSAAENAAAATGPQKWLYTREAALLQAIERRLCDRARFVFTLCEEDRAALGVADDDKSAFLPLVTRERPPPAPSKRDITCDAALIGTWTWRPNRIGLDWFLEKVTPHLRRDFRVHVAGGISGKMRAGHPGVEFVGRVADATAFVRSGAVVPLISTAGSGVQLKTIETFELGLPSVATSKSLRGIDNVPSNCVVADDPAEFARALMEAADNAHDVDGRAFYQAQLSALDWVIWRGLEAVGHAAPKVFA